MKKTSRYVLTVCTLVVMAVPVGADAQEGFGGSRSNGHARDQVRAGYVPTPDSFSIEGLMAEHDFPVRSERCQEEDFCVLSTMGHGVHRLSNTRSAYMLVEPLSDLDPKTVKRAPLNVSVVIDRSGSMTGWKFAAALEAAHAIVEQLGPGR